MANGVKEEEEEEEESVVVEVFKEEEMREISGVKRGKDFVEVTCGCTSRRYGDAVGKLRVFLNGHLQISCECIPGCTEDNLSPAAFEKHSERESSRKWKNNIWVIVNGQKVPLIKTVLLKYYNKTCKTTATGSNKQKGCTIHRDEFVRCTRCNKERRFHVRTKEQCRFHHDALLDQDWKCSDHPHDRITCDDDEERASRRVYRGCTRSATCKGCTSCVCFGCETCCFSDCCCQTCTDFTRNAGV